MREQVVVYSLAGKVGMLELKEEMKTTTARMEGVNVEEKGVEGKRRVWVKPHR